MTDENGIPLHMGSSEGRIVYKSNGSTWFTETQVKSHASTSLSTGLGSVRAVCSLNSTTRSRITRQVDAYYPFGMNIKELSQYSDAYLANEYMYNGKMYQDEMGLNWLDYGARFYDAVLGRWHSVDPLAEKYRRWSPYNYCVDNPMRFIDPDGMRVTGYTVDEMGYFRKVNNEGGNNYDVIYKKSSYTEAKRVDYDKSGKKTGIMVSKDFLKSEKGIRFEITNDRTGETRKETNHSFKTSSHTEGTKIFEFLSENTKVEYSHEFLTKGNKELSIISTSHEKTTVTGSFYASRPSVEDGYEINTSDHSHPDEKVSKNSPEDSDYKKLIKSDSKNVITRIYNPITKKYKPY